jgi:hypothetical protein
VNLPGHEARREYIIPALSDVGREMGVPHPSVLRVRVFLRCALPYDGITDEAICTLLLLVVTGGDRFWGRGVRAIAL